MKEKSNVVGFGTKVKSFFKFLFCVVGSGTVAFCCAALAFFVGKRSVIREK